MIYKKIILDIETTGLNVKNGDKIIEICCIELKNRVITNNIFHTYINPDGAIINDDAYKVHGINNFFLKDKPKFKEISKKFLKFIYNAELIIHNAEFDINFLNFELREIGLNSVNFYCRKIIDTLKIARKLFPGKRNSLDFLSKKFKINIDRKYHSAIKDVKLLGKVFLFLTLKRKKLFFKKKKKKIINFKIVSKNIVLPLSTKDLLRHKLFYKKYIL